MTGPTRAPATLAADLAAQQRATDEQRQAMYEAAYGNGSIIAGTEFYRTLDGIVRDVAADAAHRAGHMVTLDAALDWVAEQLADPEVQRRAIQHEMREFVQGARGPDALRTHYANGLLAALRDRATPRAPQPDTTHDTEEQP